MTLATIQRPARQPSYDAGWLLDPAEIAQRIGGTDFVPQGLRDNAAAITAALLYGAEVGLGPMQSLAKIAVINGRPTLAAETQRALILHAGHDLWIEESTVTRCIVAGRRKDSDEISRVTWTMDDARRANLAGKQSWRMYPRAMLLARASAELARAVFPDAIGGMLASEELEDDAAIFGAVSNGHQTVEEPTPPTRRRRRANVTAGATVETPPPPPSPAPMPGPAPEPGPDPEPAPEPNPEPVAPSQKALRRLFALYRDKGLAERPARLAFAENILQRKVSTSKELTPGDISTLIDALETLPEPETEPAPATFTPPPGAELPADEQRFLDELADTFDAHEADAP